MRTFDFANPDLSIPQRNDTIVPQQAITAIDTFVLLAIPMFILTGSHQPRIQEGISQTLAGRTLPRAAKAFLDHLLGTLDHLG